MSDYGQRATEDEYRRLRRRIEQVYREAYSDVTNEAGKFDKRHKLRAAKYSQMVADGKMSKDDYAAWLRGQVFQGEQWKARQQQINEILRNADITARRMIDEGRFNVFAKNANYMGFELERGASVNTSFTLYDPNTVKRLVADDPDILPPRKIPGKDKSYKWYNQQMNSAITQGIIQGEDIGQIAKRLGKLTSEGNCAATLRNARTAYTGAQNAGRLEGMHQGQRLGLTTQKKWVAITDDRTRDAHRNMDGQIKDVDKPFESDLGEIMFPGDQTAEPANVWNCRCTMVAVHAAYTGKQIHLPYNGGATPAEWDARKRQQQETMGRIRNTIDNHSGEWQLEELMDVGRDVAREVNARAAGISEKKQAEIRKRIDEIKARKQDLIERAEELDNKIWDAISAGDNVTAEKLAKQRDKLLSKVDKENEALTNAMRELYDVGDGKSAALLEIMGELRPVGGITQDNVDTYANLNRYTTQKRKTRQATIEAMNCYPTSWLQQSVKSTAPLLKPHWTTGRAYYSNYDGEIRFDGVLHTGVHELGHRFEYTVPGIIQSERAFYAKRTTGEPLKWLGPGYSRDEKTRRDDFIHPYMGKDYGGRAFELVSMGFQYAMTEYSGLEKDPEMLSWILGLLTAVP